MVLVSGEFPETFFLQFADGYWEIVTLQCCQMKTCKVTDLNKTAYRITIPALACSMAAVL